MSEWRGYKLGDLLTLEYGKSLSDYHKQSGPYPVFGTNGSIGYANTCLSSIPSVIIGRKGAYRGVHFSSKPFFVIDTAFYVKPKSINFDMKYIFYFISTLDINAMDSGSAIPSTDRYELYEIDILLPPLPEQKAIAAVLSSLDDKIDLLRCQNKTLEAMSETLFRQWFVEEADEGWEEVSLGDFIPVITGKKDANFGTEDGQYPFFTCSQNAIKAPDYSFDGSAILLAGNGDFNVKRYIGKFEAYQRTYVLIPYDRKYFDFLYALIKYFLEDITGGHQGSVINFITKGMITGFKFLLPKDRTSISSKLETFQRIYSNVDSNVNQIRTLENLRDTLLPKLISGEVRVAL